MISALAAVLLRWDSVRLQHDTFDTGLVRAVAFLPEPCDAENQYLFEV